MMIFKWEKFKQGKIVVECCELEIARNFIWECERQGYIWDNDEKVEIHYTGWDCPRRNIYYVVNKYGKLEVLDETNLEHNVIKWEKYKFETVEEKYNFIEVMVNKKPYQTWIGENYIINVDEKDNIKISYKDCSKTEPIQSLNIDLTSKVYVLQEIKITFDEALSICEKDDKKIMRSVINGCSYKIEYSKFKKFIPSKNIWEESSMQFEEIKGKWIIDRILYL